MFDYINNFVDVILTFYSELSVLPHTLIMIGMIMVPLLIVVAYYTYAERKIIAAMQVRLGPNVVGPKGLMQPLADGVKLFFKEIVIPTDSNKFLFLLAPVITFTVAFAAWAVIPFDGIMVLSDINAGLLYVLAMTSLGIYGIIIAGWASNSKYALLGAMRSASLIIAYEIAMGFALVGVIMISGSLNLGDIISSQKGSIFNWFWVPLFPIICYLFYFRCG